MSSLQNAKHLIVGLGNPGRAYNDTRHNIGFRVIDALAGREGWKLHYEPRFLGEVAQGAWEEKKILLLKPDTYMNLSGESVQKMASYLEVESDRLLIICDDIAFALGQMKLKPKGSAGGHNGLKSIEAHLGTMEYPRLRIGVGDRTQGDLADHVLGKFTEEERAKLPTVVDRALETLDIWINEGIDSAMRFANQRGEE